PNLLHVCFDNSAHASTGGQPTISGRVPLEALARTAGYRWTGRVDAPEELEAALPVFFAREGPAFLLVRIALGPPGSPGPRIPWTPPEMTARLRRALGTAWEAGARARACSRRPPGRLDLHTRVGRRHPDGAGRWRVSRAAGPCDVLACPGSERA